MKPDFYLILPARSPLARCLPSGLILKALTPFLPSYAAGFSAFSPPANSISFKEFSSGSTYMTFINS